MFARLSPYLRPRPARYIFITPLGGRSLFEMQTVIAGCLGNSESMNTPVNALRDRAQAYLRESAGVKLAVAETSLESILKAAALIAKAFRDGKKLMLCGNGGSAADCQHMAAEFVGVLSKDFKRAGLPAIALTTDTSFITAYANDFGFDRIFEHQVETLGTAGDVLIGISTSGESVNVLRAIEAAQAAGIRTVALAGSGGTLASVAEVVVRVPSSDTQHIQEAHLAIEHLICELVERQLFSEHP